jgi:hypothetical protein
VKAVKNVTVVDVPSIQEKCVHMYVNAKIIPVETIARIRGGEVKKSSGRGEFKYDIFDIL